MNDFHAFILFILSDCYCSPRKKKNIIDAVAVAVLIFFESFFSACHPLSSICYCAIICNNSTMFDKSISKNKYDFISLLFKPECWLFKVCRLQISLIYGYSSGISCKCQKIFIIFLFLRDQRRSRN